MNYYQTGMEFSSEEHQHLRHNPLTDEWVLVCPNRLKRPWKGQEEKPKDDKLKNEDKNPLCPNAIRPNGVRNEDYTSTFVFDNDFPALQEDTPEPTSTAHHLLKMASARGKCRVMCFHPRSDLTLATMETDEILKVIETWVEEYKQLGERFSWIQIFENRGEVMGCSNPHPHCQIWATDHLPVLPKRKDENQRKYFENKGKPLLLEYVELELKERVES